MQEIKRVLRSAAWRLFLLDLVRTLTVAASAGVAALIVLRLVQQVFGLHLSAGTWWSAAGIAAGAAALGGLVWSAARRARGVAVARELDERAELRESLSTALCVERDDSPWSRAVVETARDRATKVRVREAIPIEPPRFWPVPLALGLSLAIVWFAFPRIDVLGLFEERQQADQLRQEIQKVSAEVKSEEKKLDELLKKANVDLKSAEKADGDKTDQLEPQSPDEIKRAAIKRLTSLNEKLSEMKSGEKAAKMEAIKEQLKKLKQPGPGPLDELSKSLAQGNFQQAQEKLEELSKKLGDNSLSDQQKEQLKEQMAKLAEQLQKLAEDRKDLEKKLEQAGLSKEQAAKLAADPQKLQEALEKMESLTDEQKKQLMEAAKAASEANKQCEGMAGQLGKMSKGMGSKGMSAEGMQGMEGMSGMLSEMEMMSEEMEGLDAAMKECAGQLAKLGRGMCEGDGECMSDIALSKPWSAGDTRKKGKGSGGPGIGEGGGGDSQDAATQLEKKMAQSKMLNGPIVGSRLVQGEQVRGESVAEFSAAVEVSTRTATEALETMQVPREYHDAVKTYFGRLQARTKAAPAETPAEPEKDGK